MEQQRVDMFMMMNNKYLPESQIPFVRDRLLACDEGKASMLHAIQLKDPTISLILSLCVATWALTVSISVTQALALPS